MFENNGCKGIWVMLQFFYNVTVLWLQFFDKKIKTLVTIPALLICRITTIVTVISCEGKAEIAL